MKTVSGTLTSTNDESSLKSPSLYGSVTKWEIDSGPDDTTMRRRQGRQGTDDPDDAVSDGEYAVLDGERLGVSTAERLWTDGHAARPVDVATGRERAV